jgi:NAD+ synthase (glutamine-hydrolysing)
MGPFGFFRIAAASPTVHVAAPEKNVDAILQLIQQTSDCDCVLFPELCITGYTCADLFATNALLSSALLQLERLANQTSDVKSLIVVGMPLINGNSLFNVAVVLNQGNILGIVPKSFLPNYREFYEKRWFQPARQAQYQQVELAGKQVPFGTDLLFQSGEAIIGIEICEDLWTPIPPSSHLAIAGANVLLNLSASNETVGKSRWRRDLVIAQSGRCIAAYAYSSAGPGESTTDVVFGGHCLIAENATILQECQLVGSGSAYLDSELDSAAAVIVADIDLERLKHDRIVQNSFADNRLENPQSYRTIEFPTSTIANSRPDTWPSSPWLKRPVDALPFVPSESSDRETRCAEIFAIQVAGLAKRVKRLPASLPLVIGVSGGLDSTLALLVAIKMCDTHQIPRDRILGLTMPGFGTSAQTRQNAITLMNELGIKQDTIDIRQLCLDTFLAIKHQPLGIEINAQTTIDGLQRSLQNLSSPPGDLVFENVQARVRTLLLMSRGFVLGTGDLSEQALGWSTYNGDHMSMYNVNTSIPKTLVRFLVRFAADHYFSDQLRDTLHDIADTPISPELLPLTKSGEIAQHTEQNLGPYELHDFFLYHFIRFGFSREKILLLAQHAQFSQPYPTELINKALDLFFERFVSQQFKRSCVPDGPKVGTVSLSPRGDWRMPSDSEADIFRQ